MEAAKVGSSTACSGAGGADGSLKRWLSKWLSKRPSSGSNSGTTLSTTHTSGGSHLASYDLDGEGSSAFDQITALNTLVVGERVEEELAKERAELLMAMKGHQIEKLCGAHDNTSALDRWLMALDIGWVLCIGDDAPAGSFWQAQRNYAGMWIRAATEITRTILRAYSDPFGCGFSDLFIVLDGRMMEDHPQLSRARFAQAAILKMLPFVDAITNVANTGGESIFGNGARAPTEKLQTLLDMRDALSNASGGIQLWLHSSSSAEAKQKSDEVLNLLSAKEHKLDEAIWNAMEEVRARILAPTDDKGLWVAQQSAQGSTDIIKVTRSLTNHIILLWNNHKLVRQIVHTAADLGKYVPEYDRISYFLPKQESTDPFTSLTLEMVASLEEELAKKSESFPDHGLRYLFLINNTCFIWQQLHPLFGIEIHMSVLSLRIEDYIQRYVQVSWAPVLLCLYDLTPLCFGRNSTLLKFESEFQKIYTAQKLWKVPDPELRSRLRKAITEKVISGFTKYLEHNSISTPRVTSQELDDKLQEIFEG